MKSTLPSCLFHQGTICIFFHQPLIKNYFSNLLKNQILFQLCWRLVTLQSREAQVVLVSPAKTLGFVNSVLHNITTTQLKQLNDMVVIDEPSKHFRFQLVHVLSSFKFSSLWLNKSRLADKTTGFSLTFLFKNANWLEREVWEMFGVRSSFDINLTRLLTDYTFRGFPLRKDFLSTGPSTNLYSIENHSFLVFQPALNQSYKLAA